MKIIIPPRLILNIIKIIFFSRMMLIAIYYNFMKKKICTYCKEEKHIINFPRHIMYKDNLDMRCKDCIKKQKEIRKKLHKNAPPKPTLCECCKSEPLKWCLDHDHTTNEFRGWICERCNTGIGKLGDDVDGIVNALNYLINYKYNMKGKNEK